MRDHSRLLSFLIVVAAFAVSLFAFPHLPARMAIHWDLSGNANAFGGRAQGAFLMPCVMLVAWALLIFLPGRDRSLFIRYEDRASDASTARPVYGVIVAAILAMLLAMHVFAITTALGALPPNTPPLVIAVILSIASIVIGNYMPRVTRRNAFVGFRVPWAYASEEVWRRTQRAGGYGLVAAGLFGLVGAFVAPATPLRPFGVATAVQIAAVLVYSYATAHSRDVR